MRFANALVAVRRVVPGSLRREDDGQDLLEYGLLMALIAVFAMGAVATLGNTISTVFWNAIAASF
jgi:Flp pilus assembly pilin Flp